MRVASQSLAGLMALVLTAMLLSCTASHRRCPTPEMGRGRDSPLGSEAHTVEHRPLQALRTFDIEALTPLSGRALGSAKAGPTLAR
jgi:hypothetical protein